jgi:hypothetical protein
MYSYFVVQHVPITVVHVQRLAAATATRMDVTLASLTTPTPRLVTVRSNPALTFGRKLILSAAE